MIYFQLEKAKALFLPKRQTSSDWGTQSRWVLMMRQDSRVAEESNEKLNPKVLPLGFLFKGRVTKMRETREYKQDTVYYISVRSLNRELLFKDDSDYQNFLEILKERKTKYNFKLYAYCFLPRHYHLLIEPSQDANISKIMQALNTSYSLYFNKKYNRTGHLTSGRFESGLFNNKDINLLNASAHIHLNALRIGLVEKLEDYKWSSHLEYLEINNAGLTDKDYILSLSNLTDKEAMKQNYKELIDREAAKLETAISAGKNWSFLRIPSPIFAMAAVILAVGLIISLKFIAHNRQYNIGKSFAKQQVQAVLPQGLPIYSAASKTQERQVWELWRLGPQE